MSTNEVPLCSLLICLIVVCKAQFCTKNEKEKKKTKTNQNESESIKLTREKFT
jgi:hypothetical protein